MTLYELKEKLATLNAQINVDANWIAEFQSTLLREERQKIRSSYLS